MQPPRPHQTPCHCQTNVAQLRVVIVDVVNVVSRYPMLVDPHCRLLLICSARPFLLHQRANHRLTSTYLLQ